MEKEAEIRKSSQGRRYAAASFLLSVASFAGPWLYPWRGQIYIGALLALGALPLAIMAVCRITGLFGVLVLCAASLAFLATLLALLTPSIPI